MATTGEEKEKGMREGKSWSTPEWDEARGVSDESQGVEDGGGAAASELLAIYGSPFWPTPPLPSPPRPLPRGRSLAWKQFFCSWPGCIKLR